MAVSATYYVSKNDTNASDNNSGTLESPWRTISQMMRAIPAVTAGDTVIVKAGVYTESSSGIASQALKFSNMHGTADAPIQLLAAPNETVVIDQSDTRQTCVFIQSSSYIHIKGFELRNCYFAGVRLLGASDILIENNHIHHVDVDQGANSGAVRDDGSGYITIRNNRMHDITESGDANGPYSYGQSDNNAGILVYTGHNYLIENNEIYNSSHGIYHKRANPDRKKGFIVRYNEIYRVFNGVFYSIAGTGNNGHTDQEVYQNIFYDIGPESEGANNGQCIGISLIGENALVPSIGLDIYNNVFADCGISFSGFSDIVLYNNIFYNPRGLRYFGIPAYLRMGFNEISRLEYQDYNLYQGTGVFVADPNDGTQGSKTLSEWQQIERGDYNTILVDNPDKNSIAADPLFVDVSKRNYRLLSGSPARNAGRNSVNIGPYITGQEVIGLASVDVTSDENVNCFPIVATKGVAVICL